MSTDDPTRVVQAWCPHHEGWFEDIAIAVVEQGGGWCPRCDRRVADR